MKKYASKIDLIIVLPTVTIMGASALQIIIKAVNATPREEGIAEWFFAVLLLGLVALTIHLVLTTHYVIDGQLLFIRSGFLHKITLEISTIRKIEETNNPISAPAVSFDRLEIFYNRFDTVLVSPKDKQGFIEDLIKINPSIVIKSRHNCG